MQVYGRLFQRRARAGNPTLTCLHVSSPAGSAERNICLAGNSNCTSTSLPKQTALMYERRLFPPSQQSAPPSALEDGDLSKTHHCREVMRWNSVTLGSFNCSYSNSPLRFFNTRRFLYLSTQVSGSATMLNDTS